MKSRETTQCPSGGSVCRNGEERVLEKWLGDERNVRFKGDGGTQIAPPGRAGTRLFVVQAPGPASFVLRRTVATKSACPLARCDCTCGGDQP